MEKYQCVCCEAYSMDEKPPGTYQICAICNWEDDNAQYNNPDLAGGANRLSLNEARSAYKKYHSRSDSNG